MKAASAALITHLATARMMRCADLYAITLSGGTTYRFTSLDMDLKADGYTWNGGSPLIRRTGTRRTLGIEVATMDMTVTWRAADTLGSALWSDVIRLGILDGATVEVRRGYWSDWAADAIGTLHVFGGRVSDIDGGLPEVTISLRSETELFDVKLPRSIYQAGCRNTLYDTGTCKAVRTEVSCSAGSGGTRVRIATALGQADGWFTGGIIRGVAGLNAGVVRGIKQHVQAGGQIIVAEPWPVAPAAGDGFLVSAGCDRTRATCAAKFNNAANYRGEPYTPSPETTL